MSTKTQFFVMRAMLGACLWAAFVHVQATPADFWVGLASFKTEENARTYAQIKRDELPSQHAQRSVVVAAADTTKGKFYRVLVGPFPQEMGARTGVDDMRRAGFNSAWFVRGQVAEAAPAPFAEPRLRSSLIARTEEPARPATRTGTRPQQVRQAATKADPIETAKAPRQAPRAPLGIQVGPGERVNLHTVAEGAIKIDGHVDEAEWLAMPAITNFVTTDPATLEPGEYPTEVRFLYNEDGLYFSAIMHQPPETLVKRLTGRDQRDNRDRIGITIDTSGEGLYGFWFGVFLGDSVMDGTVLPERIFANDWDGPWYGRSQTLDIGWSAEIFVPWGTVSMPAAEGERQMGIYVARNVAYLSENWAWPALPSTEPKFMSAMQPLVMQNVEPRQQYSVYPFVASAYDWVDEDTRYRVGADVFWRPSSNFQLNATVNPDFGNVESDDVVINLTATETFFPEKRLFFLEGQEVFSATPRSDTRSSGVGNTGAPYTMVNTRRIGGRPLPPILAPGVTISQRELALPSELIGAVKTTGQIGSYRYGVMGAFEEEVRFNVTDNGTPRRQDQAGNDYGVARLLYEDSSGEGYRALGFLSTAVLNSERGDALVQGVDWHYLRDNGGVKIDGQFMSSDLDRIDERGYGGFMDFEFTYAPGVRHRVGLEYFDENIDINDLGFLQRNDHYRIRSAFTLTSSNISWARQNQLDIRGFVQRNVTEDQFNSGGIFFSNRTDFKNLSRLVARAGYFPSYYDDLNSFGNGTYRIESRSDFNLTWTTDNTQPISVRLGAGFAEDNLGDPGYNADFGLTWRPSYRFGLEFGLKYRDQSGWLLHQGDDLFTTFEAEQWLPNLSLEYFINARQQLRMSLQWVGIRAQEKDFFRIPATPGRLLPIDKPNGPGDRESYDFSVSQYAFQLRYRWEMAPLSDLFLVYTRQASLRMALGEAGFEDLFNDAWDDPLADIFVLKIRYRFGS